MNAITQNAPGPNGLTANPFAATARAIVANGWSVFPQERHGDRRPSRIHGRTLCWQSEHHLADRRPTEADLRDWVAQAPDANVAAVLGEASGRAFAVDIDCTDPGIAAAVEAIASEHLGPTPFRRVGRAPKSVLVYRYPEGDAPRSAQKTLEVEHEDRQMVEILGPGKPVTIHGLHHKTGQFFIWTGDANPIQEGPSDAPEVTSQQVEAFLSTVRDRFGFKRSAWDGMTTWAAADAGRVVRATVEVGQSGRIGDGREEYLSRLVLENVKANIDAVRGSRGDDEAVRQVCADLGAAVADGFAEHSECTGRWAPASLAREVKEKVWRTVAKVQAGELLAEMVSPAQREAEARAALARETEELEAIAARNAAVVADMPDQPPQPGGDPLAPFRCLGYDRDRFFFLGRGGQVSEMGAGQLAQLPSLLTLAPFEYWSENFVGSKSPVNLPGAAEALVRASVAAGIYASDRVRGRGAWMDGGHAVLHLGGHVVVEGQRVRPEDVAGRHVYERSQTLDVGSADPLTAEEGELLIRLCCALPLRDQPGQGKLLAGWLAVAGVCGALPWRTHLYLTGERGQGKSWAMDNIIRPALGGLAIAAQGKTTEAGIRAELGHDARPVVLDEFETQSAVDRARVQQILDLFRAASSEDGAPIRKATKDQRARAFSTRSCLVASSINCALSQAADESRFVVLEFRLPNGDREAGFQRLRALQKAVVNKALPARLLARSLGFLPAIRESAETLASVIAREGGDRRQGDTVGVPLAGLWSLTHEDPITDGEALALVRENGWVRDAIQAADSDPEWRRALDYVMQIPMRVAGSNRDDEVHVGVAVDHLARGAVGEIDASDGALRKALADFGIRVEAGSVVFGTSSSALAEAFERTDYGRSWAKTLARAPGAAPTAPKKFSGVTSRGIAVPVVVACPAEV